MYDTPTADPIAKNTEWTLSFGGGRYAVRVERTYGAKIETKSWPLSMN